MNQMKEQSISALSGASPYMSTEHEVSLVCVSLPHL